VGLEKMGLPCLTDPVVLGLWFFSFFLSKLFFKINAFLYGFFF